MIDRLKGLGNLASLKLIRSDITRFILFTTCMAISSITQAADLIFKTECIGSYSLDLPDNIEIALFPIERYLQPRSNYPNYFLDGKWAILSTFNYNRNNIDIADGKFNKKILQNIVSQLNSDYDERLKSKYQYKIKNINNNNKLVGYYSDYASNLALIANERIYTFYSNERYQGKEKDFAFYKQNAESIINNFRTRELFEVPKEAGKCIPYGFVAGNDKTMPINMTISFRLNEHPDIVISFSESTWSFTNSLSFSSKDEINLFWNTNYDIDNDNIKNIKLLGFPFKYRDIKMDGRKGLASFVEIRYKDNAPSDYGYYSIVEQYPVAKQSSKNYPWLIMSVIGKQSESKGKTPLTKDEIYELAKKIEASIKRRATEQ